MESVLVPVREPREKALQWCPWTPTTQAPTRMWRRWRRGKRSKAIWRPCEIWRQCQKCLVHPLRRRSPAKWAMCVRKVYFHRSSYWWLCWGGLASVCSQFDSNGHAVEQQGRPCSEAMSSVHLAPPNETRDFIGDRLSLTWQLEIEAGGTCQSEPPPWTGKITRERHIGGPTLGLVYLFSSDPQFLFPHLTSAGDWEMKPLGALFGRSILAKILRIFGSTMDEMFDCLLLCSFRCKGHSAPGVRIFVKGSGTYLKPPVYTSSWRSRSARGLARPFYMSHQYGTCTALPPLCTCPQSVHQNQFAGCKSKAEHETALARWPMTMVFKQNPKPKTQKQRINADAQKHESCPVEAWSMRVVQEFHDQGDSEIRWAAAVAAIFPLSRGTGVVSSLFGFCGSFGRVANVFRYHLY